MSFEEDDFKLDFTQVPFQLISNYKTGNRDIWESFVGLAPKYYGQDNSFVTLLEKHKGIYPFVQINLP